MRVLREVLSEILREALNPPAQGQAGGCCVSENVGAVSLGMWAPCLWECGHSVSGNVAALSLGTLSGALGAAAAPLPLSPFPLSRAFHIPIDNVLGTF